LGPIPAIWGNVLAMYVINTLCNQPFDPSPVESRGRRYWDGLVKNSTKLETNFSAKNNVEEGILSKEDAYYIVEYMWQFQSAFCGEAASKKDGLLIVRWDTEKPLSVDNAIPLLAAEASSHYDGTLQWSKEKMQEIEGVLAHLRDH